MSEGRSFLEEATDIALQQWKKSIEDAVWAMDTSRNIGDLFPVPTLPPAKKVKMKIKKSKLDNVDYYMKYLGGTLNLLDPDGTFKGMPDEETLKKLMQSVREDYRKLSDAILALRKKQ